MKKNTHFLGSNVLIVFLFSFIYLFGFSNITRAKGKDNFEYPPTPSLSVELEELILESPHTNEKVNLDLFVMSHCPYGIEAELALLPYVKENKDKINLNIYYIADEMEDGSFESMHGKAEVEEDIRQLIIKRLYPEKHIDYIIQRGELFYDTDWTDIADDLNIDVGKVSSLLEKEESLTLFRNNIKLASIKGVNGSPSLFVEDVKFKGKLYSIDNLPHFFPKDIAPKNFSFNSNGECTPGTIRLEWVMALQPAKKVWIGEICRVMQWWKFINWECDLNGVWTRNPGTTERDMGSCDKDSDKPVKEEIICDGNMFWTVYTYNIIGSDGKVHGTYEKKSKKTKIGKCKKCVGGEVVNNDEEDPGICKKCLGGKVVFADDEDPGVCKKCEDGEVKNEDTQDLGTCKTCENGEIINDDTLPCDDGDPCTTNDRCVNGICIGDPVTSSEDPNCGGK